MQYYWARLVIAHTHTPLCQVWFEGGGVYGDETEQGWVSIQQHEVDRTSNAARRFLYPGFILEQSQRKALIRSETPLTARHCRHQVGETDGCNLPSSLVPREVCELISLVLIKLWMKLRGFYSQGFFIFCLSVRLRLHNYFLLVVEG